MGLSSGFLIFAGILLLNSDFTNAQTRRNQSPRAGPTGRALGLNPKGTSSSSSEFQCPEEFGYFPHPSDCSLYYVCVFGGALQESCTGGLMYSHELQTCDWPRNVGCEASEVSKPAPAPAREVTPRVPQVSSRVRFSSLNVEQTAPSGPSGPSGPSAPSAPAHIQQIQTLPPPPNQQRISPKPVITSRGQPPSFTQDEILKQLYEETHDTLPPAEEEETDRNQRVYRGQPSTVTQVQRDRDGIIHQPSHNAIPTQNKVGSFSFTNSQIPTFTSEDELQDLDITKHKVLDRKRRDLSSLTDSNEESNIKTEHLENESETETDSTKRIEKRSNDDETHVSSLDEVSEILEGSENSDDVQRLTRQLRPSIISSPWRISNGRAVNFSPSNQNSYGSSFSGFPSAQSGFLYKSDGRFYPTNPYKTSSDDFRPVISTYSGNNNKNKYNFQSFGSNSGSSSGYAYESSDRDQEATPKYKQSSKIPSQSSALLPLIYSLESFEPKAKQTTTPPPIESQDNYSYFHLGKGSSSQTQHHQQQQQHQYQDKVKTYAFPITNQQPQQTTTQRSFVSFNSVGGFFNNNQQQSNQGFLPIQSSSSSGSSKNNNNNNSNKVTPAPIYEGIKSASSYDSRYTSPAPIKKSQSTPQYSSNGFLNNLNFNKNAATVFNFGIDSAKEREKQREEKVIEITTKKQSYKQQQYPIPTSTPKYIQSYTTPNQLFDVDKFIAELRETQRLQNVKNIGGNLSPHNIQQQHSIYKINNNKTQSLLLNKTPNIRYQYFTSPSPSSTTASPDEYYYDDQDEEVEHTYDNGANLSKLKVQSDKVNSNKDNYSSHTLNKKPNLITSNAAAYDDDEYYEDYEDEEEEFKFLPPPVNKPKYTPMTETMAPRPINVTTLRPYYVSGQTFSTPSPISSTIPSIIKFPDDVFQAIRPFTSLSPKIYSNGNNANKIIKTNHLSGSYDFTKGTTQIPHSTTKLTTKAPKTTTTTERTTTRKTKLKIITKATTAGKKQQVTSTTVKPTRTAVTTTRRKLYTSKANNRGNLRFKPSTKRPDLTRLEIDEKLPNRVEQSSPAPSAFNIPSKTQITQNKNYYNTSNYNTNFDPFYPSYDDGVDIYSDVDYSNIYNQPKSTPSSTYRPTTTQSPQTFATRPQTQSTTYLTQTQAPPKQKYNQQNIYSSADYDDGLNAQLEESERYGQQEEDSSNFRPSNRNPSRGSSAYAGETQSTVSQNSGRGTSPTRARPTLKPAQIVTKDAQQFVDIYRHQPTRIEPLYPQPVPDKTAAKCRKDVCLLPDCYCGGKDIPGKLPLDETPQLVLITFEDSVNDVHNKVFEMLFNSSRKNPNGCEIRATFFISHEWTDYGLVQDLYADGHEIASHSVSHSFGEQFSLKKWAREIAGQREILSAYGGVKQDDIRGMRAPFLSIGGNKMFKMLYDFNFTYDSSMPVYENRPPSWPYTLDYKLFHDCMIPPCPTKSYPGVWEVPMVMWQDLNGGRCSMGDACSNPAESEGVYKMIMKNFERHYTTNRAPFGLFYHAAWFTQPHHKEGFIQFLDAINSMKDVYIVTNWQALQWVRDPTPISRMQSFQPFQCNYQDRPKRCNNPKVCNLWHKSGVRYMRTCQPCPEIYPWTGKTGIRSSRIDNDLEVVEST